MDQKHAADLLEHGPTLAICFTMSYADFMQYISNVANQNRMLKCVKQITKHTPPQIIITSYMIACFPADVFGVTTPLEETLIEAARAFTTQLDATARHASKGHAPDAQATANFLAAIGNYHTKFTNWHAAEVPRVAGVLSDALLGLYEMQAVLPVDAPALVQVNEQIARLECSARNVAAYPRMK
jgi:hypothetical protein